MIKIGLISDTHLNNYSPALMQRVRKPFQNIDKIFHAGDIVHSSIIDALEEFAPVTAVRGNMDLSHMHNDLPLKRVMKIEGYTIGLIHGWGAPGGIHRRIYTEFEQDTPDAIVFGHSHNPIVLEFRGCLMVNPGSPTDNRFTPYTSVGVLTLDSSGIRGEIIKL